MRRKTFKHFLLASALLSYSGLYGTPAQSPLPLTDSKTAPGPQAGPTAQAAPQPQHAEPAAPPAPHEAAPAPVPTAQQTPAPAQAPSPSPMPPAQPAMTAEAAPAAPAHSAKKIRHHHRYKHAKGKLPPKEDWPVVPERQYFTYKGFASWDVSRKFLARSNYQFLSALYIENPQHALDYLEFLSLVKASLEGVEILMLPFKIRQELAHEQVARKIMRIGKATMSTQYTDYIEGLPSGRIPPIGILFRVMERIITEMRQDTYHFPSVFHKM